MSSNKLKVVPDSIRVIFNRTFKLKFRENPVKSLPLWYIGLAFDEPILSLCNINIDHIPKLYPTQNY
jgi:hypothetical protein